MQPTHEMNESLGTYLKRAREGKNVSIEQVAYATRISLKMLRALEEDDHTALPAPTFVRGYLQAYAKYVRIDTQDLLLRYQHHLATAPDAKRGAIRSHYLYVRERYQEKRRLVLVIVLFATMLSVAGAYFFLKAQREKHKRLAKTAELIQKSDEVRATATSTSTTTVTAVVAEAPLPPAKKPPAPPVVVAPPPPTPAPKPTPPPPAPVVVAPPPPAPAPAPAPTPVAVPAPPPAVVAVAEKAETPSDKPKDEKKAYQLLLKATEDVWFRYQLDTEEVKDLTLRSGKAMMLRADKVIKIFSGNLGALKATLNGKEMAVWAGTKGTKSVVLPEAEAPNYKLPLFPQFQTKAVPPAEKTPPPSEHPRSPPTSENSPVPSP